MTVNLFSVVEDQRKALLEESIVASVAGLPIAAVQSIRLLTDRALVMAKALPEATVEPLEPPSEAAYVQRWQGYKTLWAATDNDDYREHYAVFVRKHYRLPAVDKIPASYDVDHLYNRARAKQLGLNYIRMLLIPPGINRSHGAGFEKAVTNAEANRPVVPVKKMDDFMWMKALGVPSPRKGKPLTAAQQDYLTRIARIYGLPSVDLLRENLERRFMRVHGA